MTHEFESRRASLDAAPDEIRGLHIDVTLTPGQKAAGGDPLGVEYDARIAQEKPEPDRGRLISPSPFPSRRAAKVVCLSRVQGPPLVQPLARWALHRIDAWGVAFIVCLVAILVHDALEASSLLLAVSFAFAYFLGYAVNDFCDASDDAQDESKARLNFFVSYPLRPSVALAGFLASVTLLFLSFARFGGKGVGIFALCLVIMWAYSAPPLRLKARPGIDLLAHALFVQTFAYIVCLFLIEATWGALDYLLVGVNLLASLSGQLAQQVRDFEVDSRTVTTFATACGRPVAIITLQLVTALLLVTSVAGFATGLIPWRLAPLALAFLPFAISRLRSDYSQPRPASCILRPRSHCSTSADSSSRR